MKFQIRKTLKRCLRLKGVFDSKETLLSLHIAKKNRSRLKKSVISLRFNHRITVRDTFEHEVAVYL